MPAQPSWFHRLVDIVEALRAMSVSYLDRQAVEALFKVKERRARQLMAGLPAIQVGNAVAVDRLALLRRVEEVQDSGIYQWEISRRRRLAREVERSREQWAVRQVKISVPRSSPLRGLDSLPDGMRLERGQLCVEFTGALDLAAKLYLFSQILTEDWVRVVALVGE
jgi:hypothetical protein